MRMVINRGWYVQSSLSPACRINKHSVAELMACALPYHATVEFVRLVQIMPLEKTIWTFLRPMQKSGAPLPRLVLVQRCLNDMVSFKVGNKQTIVMFDIHRCRHEITWCGPCSHLRDGPPGHVFCVA